MAASGSSTIRCRLLELPPELRNRIYEEDLIQDTDIQVTSTGFNRSALLQTCHQIRREASGIFFEQNTFLFPTNCYDISALFKFKAITDVIRKSLGLRALKVTAICPIDCPKRHWQNLLKCLRLAHETKWSPFGSPEEIRTEGIGTEGLVIGGMYHTACTLSRRPWRKVEDLLRQQRVVLVSINKRWAKDRKDEQG